MHDMTEIEALTVAIEALMELAAQHDTASPEGYRLREALAKLEQMREEAES